MRGRAFIMFGIALVLSVIAVFVARQYLTRQAAPVATQQQPAMQLATVVVARTPTSLPFVKVSMRTGPGVLP